MKKLISIIAPMYNEESIVQEFYNKVENSLTPLFHDYEFEILFVHDESSDNTLQEMKNLKDKHNSNVGIIDLTRNFGLEGAINAGLKLSKGDICVLIDADLQDPPEVIIEMIKLYEDGYDIVHGVRKKRIGDSWMKKVTAKIYYILLRKSVKKVKLYENASNFKLLSSKALQLYNNSKMNTFFRIKVSFLGMKQGIVKYNRVPRFAGNSTFGFKKLLNYAVDSLMSVNVKPLKLIKLTTVFSFFVFIYFGLEFILAGNSIILNASSFSLIFFSLFLLFLSLTIISEYFAKLIEISLNEPLFLVSDYFPSGNAQKKLLESEIQN